MHDIIVVLYFKSNMKVKLILLTILVLLFLGYVGVKFLFLDKQNQFGRVKVLSSPATSVFINNVESGKTPYEGQLKVGDALIKLIPQGEATSTASWQGKVKIYKNTLTYINRELGSSEIASAGEIFTATRMDKKPSTPDTGEIYVDTDPVGAIVSLNNDEKGIAPLVLSNIPKGQHEISVYIPGFFRRTQKVNIESGFRVNAQFKLAVDEDQKKEEEKRKEKNASDSAKLKKKITVVIKETPTGFLRVRQEPSVNASESAQVKPGDKFELLAEQEGWYKISYEKGKEGWISAQYSSKEASESAR